MYTVESVNDVANPKMCTPLCGVVACILIAQSKIMSDKMYRFIFIFFLFMYVLLYRGYVIFFCYIYSALKGLLYMGGINYRRT